MKLMTICGAGLFLMTLLTAVPLHASDTTLRLPTPAVHLPALSARYETRIIQLAHRPRAENHTWYLARDAHQVEVWNEAAVRRQVWHQADDGAVDYSRLFIRERKRVDYTAGDLRSLGRYPVWAQIYSVIDPAVLSQLKLTGKVRVLGRQAERYQGQVHGVDMEIVWLPDAALPALVRRVYGDSEVSMHLVALHTGKDAPWPRIDTRDYDAIDYADLGDMEADPFVRQLHVSENGHGR